METKVKFMACSVRRFRSPVRTERRCGNSPLIFTSVAPVTGRSVGSVVGVMGPDGCPEAPKWKMFGLLKHAEKHDVHRYSLLAVGRFGRCLGEMEDKDDRVDRL